MGASTQWQREEFVPDTGRMAVRPDGSYSTLIVQVCKLQLKIFLLKNSVFKRQ